MVPIIVLVVVIVAVGVGYLSYRNRPEKGIESGIHSFRRELHALAPRPGIERSARPSPDPTPDRIETVPGAADQADGAEADPTDTTDPIDTTDSDTAIED